MIDQNLSHELRGHGKKMRPVLPLRKLLVSQANVGLMHQGSALKRMSGTLVAQVALRDALQFVVNQRNERVQSLAVAATPPAQQLSHLSGRVPLHSRAPNLLRGSGEPAAYRDDAKLST